MTNERLIKLWDHLLSQSQFTGDGCCPNVVEIAKDLLPNSKEYPKVLDLACGDGYWIKWLKNKGYTVEGIDLLHENKDLNIIKGDMHFTPYEKESFDWIFCNNSYEHAISPLILTIEIKRLLRSKGLAFIVIPGEDTTWVYDNQHYSVLPRKQIENLFVKCGMQLVKYMRVMEDPKKGADTQMMQIFLFMRID